MRSTPARQRSVLLTVIHGLLVTHKGKSATPTANNCQGQMKTPQSVSVLQLHDCTHKGEWASPRGKTNVKVKWKLLSQYQYSSHMIVHTRENWLHTAKLSRSNENSSVSISTPITWLKLVRKHTNTDTAALQKTHRSTRTRLRALSRFVASA
jgi:hypothetical protein